MRKHVLSLAAALAAVVLACEPARALEVFACEPEWAALAKELGGDAVNVTSATSARQDPHQVQARPALIARLRAADLVVCTGAELEVGWMPVLLRQAGNPRIQPGQPAYFEAAGQVRLLDVPTRLDRAEGDVHAAGNPHIQTDPRNMRAVAVGLGKRLAEIDPANGALYLTRAQDFDRRMAEAIARWQEQAAPLKGMAVAVQHKSWVYLLSWLGMTEAAAVEPKPGVPPGSAYVAQLVDELPKRGIHMILYAAYQDGRPSEFLAEKTGAKAVMLPFTIGGSDEAKDLFAFYDDTIRRLLAGAQ